MLGPTSLELKMDSELIRDASTEAALTSAINVVFEKAIRKPSYAAAYARLCEMLHYKSMGRTRLMTAIVVKCQDEFEKVYYPWGRRGINKVPLVKEVPPVPAQTEAQLLESTARRTQERIRCIGTVRFIAEIYKRGFLPVEVMHWCMNQLLESPDEESLEAICVMLCTAGKNIESETNQGLRCSTVDEIVIPLDHYFLRIQTLMKDSSSLRRGPHSPFLISNRLHFLLVDLINLRKRGWVPLISEPGSSLSRRKHLR